MTTRKTGRRHGAPQDIDKAFSAVARKLDVAVDVHRLVGRRKAKDQDFIEIGRALGMRKLTVRRLWTRLRRFAPTFAFDVSAAEAHYNRRHAGTAREIAKHVGDDFYDLEFHEIVQLCRRWQRRPLERPIVLQLADLMIKMTRSKKPG